MLEATNPSPYKWDSIKSINYHLSKVLIIYETAYAGENVSEAFKQRYSDKLVHFQLLYSFSNWNKISSNSDKLCVNEF